VPQRRRVLLAGVGDLYDEVCTALEEAGAQVQGLKDPDDDAVRDALEDASFDVVCVVAREDALPLRIALLVRHLDEEVPLVVTVFDREMATQLEAAVPRLEVTSLADIIAPSLAGPCIEPGITSVHRDDDGSLVALREPEDDEPLQREAFEPPRTSVVRALATSIFAPYDRSAGLMFYGLMGLVGMLAFETGGAMIVLDQAFADAVYGSTKSLATVGPNDAVADGPSWFKVVIAASMVLTLLSAACFTGGLIERLTSARLTGLVGRRAVPRRDHVVVVGLGQVGLRLCLFLRECGIPVVAVDDREEGENVGHARREKLPVVIGLGANPTILRRLSLDRARALAAVTPDDLANVEAAMAARSINEDLQVVLRGGDGEVADETRSLLRIGHVIDVHRVGAAYIAATALGRDAEGVAAADGYSRLLLPGGDEERFPPEQRV
jgi:Trk K+ transport system NAD-binding subunit